eukprot:m.174520 g.174520  ORF g.174520 m.174520 type:complete len:218 (-) comp15408_c0_seq1:6584-7237(-)
MADSPDSVKTFNTMKLQLVAVMALVSTGIVLYVSAPWNNVLFLYHPSSMAGAFLLLMPLSISLFGRAPLPSFLGVKSHRDKMNLHFYLHTGAVVLTVLGFMAIYFNKIRLGKEHFLTWHGFLGALATAGVLIQYLMSISLLFPDVTKRIAANFGGIRNMYRLHGISGFVLYALCIVVVWFGFYTTYWTNATSMLTWNIVFICTCLLFLVLFEQVLRY